MKEAVSFRFVGYHDHVRVGNWGIKGDSNGVSMGSHLNSSPHWPYNLGCVAEPIFSLRFIIAKIGMITLSSQVGWAGDFVSVLRTVAGTNWMPCA